MERELVLPSASMRIVFRLAQPLRVFANLGDVQGRTVGHDIVGGIRTQAHIRDVSLPSLSIGAELRPGTGALLLGVSADELASRHLPLADLWGAEVERIREKLLEASQPALQLDVLESALLLRAANIPRVPPGIAHAVARITQQDDIADVVADSGCSHRHFIALFRRSVGLTPKLYARIVRFQAALQHAGAGRAQPWAGLALEAGYSDQAHLVREFRAFSGLSPLEYERLRGPFKNHVPLPIDNQRPR